MAFTSGLKRRRLRCFNQAHVQFHLPEIYFDRNTLSRTLFLKGNLALLFIYDNTLEGGGRGAIGKFCRNEKDEDWEIYHFKL